MSHVQWVSAQRHTFQSDSCFSVSSGLDRGVCSASYIVFFCMFRVSTAVSDIQGELLERIVELPFLFPLCFSLRWVLSFWVLSFGFHFVRIYRLWFRCCTASTMVWEMQLWLWSWICFGHAHVLWLDLYHCSSVPSLGIETSNTLLLDVDIL